MIKICFLGLSGSGKTCYLYAASHVLTSGIQTQEGSVSILSTDMRKNILLNQGIEDMVKEKDAVWPKGSDQTRLFPYDLYINGKKKTQFEIYDYRGGALYDIADNAQDEREEIYNTFTESSCIVVFIDAYTLMTAFGLKNEEDETLAYRKGNRKQDNAVQADNQVNHLNLIINDVRQYVQQDVPILLTITKKDILSDEELTVAIDKLRAKMPILFAPDNPNPIVITAVSLGSNLGAGELNKDNKNKLTGCLHLDVSQNIHIPILFPLFLGIELSPNESMIARRIFNSKVLQMYVGGKPAIITF